MSLPRLVGPRVALVPTPYDVAVTTLDGHRPIDLATGAVTSALGAAGLRVGAGWPHPGTADALRPLAEHGGSGEDGGWLVTVDGEVVGDCGWRGGPDPDGEVEISYGLAAPARGRGLGTEAVGVLAAWAEQQPGVRRLTAEVLVGNEASLRLLRRLGFMPDGGVAPYVRWVRGVGPAPVRRITGRHVC